MWMGAFGIFMISRPNLQGSDCWKFRIWNRVMEKHQADSSMDISIWAIFGQGFGQHLGRVEVRVGQELGQGLGKCLGGT